MKIVKSLVRTIWSYTITEMLSNFDSKNDSLLSTNKYPARQFFFFFKDCGDLRAITCFCLLAELIQISTWSFQVKKEQEFQNSSPCWSTYMYLGKTPCLECIIRFQNHGFLTLFWSAFWCSKKFLIPDIARSKSLPHYRDANTPEGLWSKDF